MPLQSFSPTNPAELIAEIGTPSAAEVTAGFDRARAAQREWWQLGAAARAAALNAAADRLQANAAEVAQLMAREVGKPIVEANGEVARGVSILLYYAQASFARKGDLYPPSMAGLLWSERRPHGVAALITPWNFPVAIPLWKAAPALAAGNAVVLKPSSEAIGCAAVVVELFEGLVPAGLIQVLASREVLEHADVISFTGSNEVGRQVALKATERGVPVQTEMGGQNAAIVLPDADVQTAAGHLAMAAMNFAGQKCTATRRVITVGEQPAFIDAFIAAVEAIKVGDPVESAHLVGPLINQAARETFDAALASARTASGEFLTGGRPIDRTGWFVAPTVLRNVPADHPLSCQEVFGPLVTVHSVPDLAAAVQLANSVAYGLVTSVHGRDYDSLLQAVNSLDTGMIKVNAPTAGIDFYAPFGGEKDSSLGMREQGMAALDFYSSSRTITFAPSK